MDEAFKGVSAGQRIELHQAGSDCSAKFRTGERHVFYLRAGSNGNWFVAPCTRSLGDPDPSGDDLLFLRGLPKSAIGTRLSGEVGYYQESPKEGFKRVGGIPDVEVRIASVEPVPKEIKTKTNSAGVYEVFGLPPGPYRVSIDVPGGKRLSSSIVTGAEPSADSASVTLRSAGSAGVSFVLKDDTRVSGRILDHAGAPLKSVCLDLDPIDGRGEGGSGFFKCSEADGRFEMSMMPPGNYRLLAHDEVTLNRAQSKSTLYYPGVRDVGHAAVLSIEVQKYLENLDLRMPPGERRYILAGRVQFEDGAPAPYAVITFNSPENGYSETASADGDGTFALSAVAGIRGQLTGRYFLFNRLACSQLTPTLRDGNALRFDARPIALTADSDHEKLTLVLPSRSCESSMPGRK